MSDWSIVQNTEKSAQTTAPTANASEWSVVPEDASAPEQKSLSTKIVDTVTDPIIAAGSGVRQGATDFAGDIGSFLTEMLGKVSPTLQKHLNDAGTSVKNYMNSVDESKGFDKIQAEHPYITAAGKGVGYTAGALGATIPAPSAGLTGAASQGLLGSAMAGEGNRLAGFAGGALVPAALSSKAITAPAEFLAANAAIPKQIDDVHLSVNKPSASANLPEEYKGLGVHQATNKMFDDFRATPGVVSTVRPAKAFDDVLNSSKSLTDKQTEVLSEIKGQVQNAENLNDLHNARKALSREYDLFTVGKDKLRGTNLKTFKDLQTSLENNLQMNATRLGVKDKYITANDLYKQSKEADIVNKAFKSMTTKQGGLNYDNFTQAINKLKLKDRNQMSADTMRTLVGIQNTAKEANYLYGINTKKQMLGGVGNIPFEALRTMASIPKFKTLLQKAATPQGKALSKELAKGLLNVGQSQTVAPILSKYLSETFGDD